MLVHIVIKICIMRDANSDKFLVGGVCDLVAVPVEGGHYGVPLMEVVLRSEPVEVVSVGHD